MSKQVIYMIVLVDSCYKDCMKYRRKHGKEVAE